METPVFDHFYYNLSDSVRLMNATIPILTILAFLLPWDISPVVGFQGADSPNQRELRTIQRQYNDEIKPLLHQYCGECHAGPDAESGLNLDSFDTLNQLLEARKQWKKVIVRVTANEMPPEGSPPIPETDHDAVLQWIDHLLVSVDCTNIDPGRVTIRRLNRTEYKNTIRDLMGVNYEPADLFPGDDVGYGFDNIADVLSLPPILMEKYLHAAEQITKQAIVDPSIPVFNRTLEGNKFKTTGGSSHRNGSHVMSTQGTISCDLEIPESGNYEISVRAFQNQAGDEAAKMSLGVDGGDGVVCDVGATDDSPGEYPFLLHMNPGRHTIKVSFLNDYYVPAQEGRKAQDRNLHFVQLTIQGPSGKLPEQQRLLIPEPPENPTHYRKAARQSLNLFASRAYRRPVTPGELDRLMQLYDSARDEGDGYDLSIRLAFQAVLVSPYFLYKVEVPPATKQHDSLSEFELATRLSYFLWSTMPDRELFVLATDGELSHQRVYRQQIRRMLRDPRANALIENFVVQWLQLGSLDDFVPDPDLFPGTDRRLRNDMATETKMLVADLMGRDASVLELLESDYSFVNQRLAGHYGIEGVDGDDFQRVPASRSGRFGLMTQASILTLTSNPTRTSPVKRGKWMMENLLGESPPAPDPSVMKLEDQPELHGSLRQRMEQHRADPNCASCHLVMDQLGFALENYDAVGRWRDADGRNPIDATGKLPDGTSFEGAMELQEAIRSTMREKFVRCLTEKLLIYSLGRGLEYFDECTVDKIMEVTQANDFRFSELIVAVAMSDPFMRRQELKGVQVDHD